MSCRRSGRRKARTKARKSEASGDDKMSIGIEGMYLNLGKRNAEAVVAFPVVGAREVFVTRILLNG